MTTHHYFTRSPTIAAALDARGMFPCDYLTHSDIFVGPPNRRVLNFDCVHLRSKALSDRGDKNGLFLVNIEWMGEHGPAWCDPDPTRTPDFAKIEKTAEMFREVHFAANLSLTCPVTCTEAWLLPAWRYAGGDPAWRRNAHSLASLGMMEGATAIFCQIWAVDSDVMGYGAIQELRRNIALSDFWDRYGPSEGGPRLPRYFQLCPYTKGTPTTAGRLQPPEYTREAVRIVTEAGHNVVWFLPQFADADGHVARSEDVTAESVIGRQVLERCHVAAGGVA